jgi:uncharacterized protein DUF5691
MSLATTTTWTELLGIALVGADRRGERADEVLETAALLGGARRAGWEPPPAPRAVADPAPADHAPEAPATAVQILELLLSGAVSVAGGPDPLIADWFEHAARNGVRVPHRLITVVLDRATTNHDLRDGATTVVGERGRWLAHYNPQWSWTEVPDDAWEVCTREQRLVCLRRLRAADPRAAIALVETTWASEPADMRQQILTELARGGLVATDQAFLEAALDDRAASVRKVAEAMVDSLPSSSRASERAAELGRLVHIEGRVRKKLVIDDADAMLQLVAGVRLGFWSDHLGVEPLEVVALAREHGKLIDELIRAAVHRRDPIWADALIRNGKPNPGQAVALVGVVPEASAWLIRELRNLGKKAPIPLGQSTAVLARILDPAVVPDLEAWVAALGDDDGTRRKVRQLIQALTLRASIAKELP